MDKMREAFEKWFDPDDGQNYWDCWQAAYQAAIAAVKESGPVAWMSKDGSASQFAHPWVVDPKPLYKLPEDVK